MAVADLIDWIQIHSRPEFVWYAKRLSGNDTLANDTHQAGPYFPKKLLISLFPSLGTPGVKNPDVWFEIRIDSHDQSKRVRAVYYNAKTLGMGTRDEARVTNFGGAESPLLDPDSTGTLAVFVFHREAAENSSECRVWVCQNEAQSELIEERIGPVEPGVGTIWSVDHEQADDLGDARWRASRCRLALNEIPADWLLNFPAGSEIVRCAIERQPGKGLVADDRLVKRRHCEYEIFKSVEEAVELPVIQRGFGNVDDFVARAQSILQRRKARSGRSLELQARAIFLEEGLNEKVHFEHQAESEGGKRPDFIFPNATAYRDKTFPAQQLRMLAAKTTCKDRWRQVINEADRIPVKHLLTLQEGVSVNQFNEMTEARVHLVVPKSLIRSFPEVVRPHLLTFSDFIASVSSLSG